MGPVKTEGIVLRETKYGERDKMLTVFTSDWGTVSVSARGVRGGRGRGTGTGLFCYSSFVLYAGREVYRMNDCELIRSFHRIGEDLTKMACASYLCEIVSVEKMENLPLMRLLLNTLSLLEQTEKCKPLWQIKATFELCAAGMLGFLPQVGACVRCGAEEGLEHFSCEEGGALCKVCASDQPQIAPAVLHAMQYLLQANNPFSFALERPYVPQFSDLCEEYLLQHLERRPKTLSFLKNLQETE